MTVYLIARVRVTDQERYAAYRDRTPDIVARHGGRYIVRGGAIDTLEGTPEDRRMVVMAFDDMAAARRFYDSEAYRAIIPIRQANAESDIILVEGFDG